VCSSRLADSRCARNGDVRLPASRIGNQHAASCLVKIVVTGRQVHGSTPWFGVDPMPPAAEIITAAGQLAPGPGLCGQAVGVAEDLDHVGGPGLQAAGWLSATQ
jgi:hypothetical protein